MERNIDRPREQIKNNIDAIHNLARKFFVCATELRVPEKAACWRLF
jgi:hypothetical protein